MILVKYITHNTRVNGPGNRAIVHVQGCSLNCLGCFSKSTHSPLAEDARWMEPQEIVTEMLTSNPDGFTISGGEILQQNHADVLELFTLLFKQDLPKGLLVFSGTEPVERHRMLHWAAMRENIDCLVSGRFVASKLITPVKGLRSSSNQTVHCFTDKITRAELNELPSIEVRIGKTGNTIMGFPTQTSIGE